MPLKTRKQIREEFAHKGLSLSGWARSHGFSTNMVIAIVNDDEQTPRYKCLRGEAHNVAVMLGLKEGEIIRNVQRQAAAA
jgi:gp16 family phage-associated protein